MGGGTSIVGLGRPGEGEASGEALAGTPLGGPPGADPAGDWDPDPTQAAIDHAKARAKMIRATVRMSA
jgi:hypothetical protein